MSSSSDLVKTSTDAAERFVESYYAALNRSRSTLASFYAQAQADGAGTTTLLFNGNTVPDGSAVQEIFDKQMPFARYEAQSVDCHVINPSYQIANNPADTKPIKSHISILVLISGWVRYSEERNDPSRAFSETFVLVPNPQAESQRAGRRSTKDFLIQSQNFRLVV